MVVKESIDFLNSCVFESVICGFISRNPKNQEIAKNETKFNLISQK